jgi:uncharacterized membrane protein
MNALVTIIAVVMTGVMAGIYFSFSVFIMRALEKIPAPEGARAMNSINDVIVKTLFLPLFFGSTVFVTGFGLWQLFTGSDQGNPLPVIAAAVIYLLGMFGVTVFGNVPLNNRLKRSEENEQKLILFWRQYLHQWTRLNHVRTVSCIVSCALLAASLH